MMKRTIQQLISALSTLTSPFNPVDIKKIFDKHPPLDITQIPTELKKYAEQLLALNNLTNQSFELANQRHSLSIEQERLVQLAQVDDLTHRSIHTLQEQLRESCELVNNSFQLLMPLINANLLKQNKLNSPYTATVDSKTQQLAVEEYHDQLSRSLNEIETRAATLTFFQTTKTINDLVEELKTFGINLSAKDGKEHIQNLISSITLHLSQLKGIKPRAIELHQLFAKQLSAIELQAKIKELDQQLVTIEEQLENVRLEIAINTLDTKIKEQLSEEFLKTPNKSELIKIYHDKLPGPLSYVDPYSWKSWIHDHHRYELAQLETQNSVSYLQLLEKKYVLKLEKTRLNTQKRTLSVLMPVTQNSSEGGLAMSILVEQARILLRECGLLTTPITTPPNASASDFYLALLSSIPIVEQKSERMIIVLTGLQKLLSLDAEINQLRMRYKLDTNGDLKPANQKGLEQLVQSVESQQTIKEDLMQQLEMCQSFLARMAKLDEIEKELQAIIIRKKSMELTLGMARHEIPIPTQLHTLSG